MIHGDSEIRPPPKGGGLRMCNKIYKVKYERENDYEASSQSVELILLTSRIQKKVHLVPTFHGR